MTMVYFDTSYLLKCYVLEDASAEMRRLAGEREHVACCELGRFELVAALHRKLREHTSQEVLEGVSSAFNRLPLNASVRTGDAIHLECARRNGFSEIFSGDRHLLEATRHFGLQGSRGTS
jgi:predicted nucleic acid-binding protein